LTISYPIDGDAALHSAFVQFLGTQNTLVDCCARSRAWDGVDPQGLTTADRLAIWVYTTDYSRWYQQINSELWSGRPSPAVSNLARILNSALRKLDPYEGTVYRGFPSVNLSGDLAKYIVGSVVEWPGFTSSSTDQAKAYDENMQFTIFSHTGRELRAYSDIPHEEEVTFCNGTKFLVLRTEQQGSDAVIDLEEVVEGTEGNAQ
jgi:hypothetical protein